MKEDQINILLFELRRIADALERIEENIRR